MLSLRHLLSTGNISSVHPAGLAIFLGICLMSAVLAKSFCSYLCPVGLLSELLGRFGIRLVGRTLTPPSVFVRDLWCRYLCPYGALVGILGRVAPFKVTRDPALCTDCRSCTRVCPARLPVHAMGRVASVECTSCQDCVLACPVEACLAVRPPRPLGRRTWLRPATAALLAVGLYLGVVAGFQAAGHWHTAVTETEFNRRLQEIDSPLYTHVGGTAMAEVASRR
jgi:polyferredoxin